MASRKYDTLRERALANIELLFDYWGLQWKKLNSKEYDIINPTREDHNYGACRFNVDKGRGADFSGSYIKDADIHKIFGSNFTREDFVSIGKSEQAWGFDIIGLCLRVRGGDTFDGASKLLRDDLKAISKNITLIEPSMTASQEREHKLQSERLNILKSAEKIWRTAQPFEHTIGDKYLRYRQIFLRDEPNIKFLAKVKNTELNNFFPALIFKVSKEPYGPITAIHRIYLDYDKQYCLAKKLECDNPKTALGKIAGSAIWFGKPGPILCIAEGPETALSVRCLGYPFVASTINATNFSNLSIPPYVTKLLLFPDNDKAGRDNTEKAMRKYKQFGIELEANFPAVAKDWNDVLRAIK